MMMMVMMMMMMIDDDDDLLNKGSIYLRKAISTMLYQVQLSKHPNQILPHKDTWIQIHMLPL